MFGVGQHLSQLKRSQTETRFRGISVVCTLTLIAVSVIQVLEACLYSLVNADRSPGFLKSRMLMKNHAVVVVVMIIDPKTFHT